MTTSDTPWSDIGTGHNPAEMTARRVNGQGRLDFFWGRDAEGCPLLVLQHGAQVPSARLPLLHGLQLRSMSAGTGGRRQLVWRLTLADNIELFHELCLDIVRTSEESTSESAAVATAIARTWQWHHLLRGGRSDGLSLPEQLGLVAELLVLEALAVPCMGPLAGVRAWRGPFGEAQDFRIRDGAVEVKARTTTGVGTVQIHSAEQLDDSALVGPLWLIVATLEGTTSGTGNTGAVTLDALVERVRRSIDSDPAALDLLQTHLSAAGYAAGGLYSHREWTTNRMDVYRVEGAFPRLTPAALPVGVGKVQYALAPADCAAFIGDMGAVRAWIRSGVDA